MVRNVENTLVQEFDSSTGKWKTRPQAIYEGTRAEREAMPTESLKKDDIFWQYGGDDGQTEGKNTIFHWNGAAWV